jgi:hypothetical protein
MVMRLQEWTAALDGLADDLDTLPEGAELDSLRRAVDQHVRATMVWDERLRRSAAVTIEAAGQ